MKEEKVRLSIIMFSNGEITLHGPVQDKILCWGLLRAAEEIVSRYKADSSNIVVPDIMVPKGMSS